MCLANLHCNVHFSQVVPRLDRLHAQLDAVKNEIAAQAVSDGRTCCGIIGIVVSQAGSDSGLVFEISDDD